MRICPVTLCSAVLPLLAAADHAFDSYDHGLQGLPDDLPNGQNDFLYVVARAKPDTMPEGGYCKNGKEIRKDEKALYWKQGTPGKGPKDIAANMVLYSSRLTFPNTKNAFQEVLDGEDAQLSFLTKEAWEEMYKIMENAGKRKQPTVMTAMAIDDRIYLSSSIVGTKRLGNLIVDINTWQWRDNIPEQLKECFKTCQYYWGSDNPNVQPSPFNPANPADGRWTPEDIHRTGASCGECGALYQYFQDNPTREDCDKAVFVTVTDQDAKLDVKKLRVVDPCGVNHMPGGAQEGERWGCALLTSMCKDSRFIAETPNPYAFSKYYFGPWTKETEINEQKRTQEEPDAEYRRSQRFFEKKFIPLDIGELRLEEPARTSRANTPAATPSPTSSSLRNSPPASPSPENTPPVPSPASPSPASPPPENIDEHGCCSGCACS